MSLFHRFVLVLCLAGALGFPAWAREEAPAIQAQALVAFKSDEGMARLLRSQSKSDFTALANQFEAQINAVFCGPATAAIVLNALQGERPGASRVTQESVIAKGRKTRAQVLGEPVTINGRSFRDYGYQLRQLDELLRAHGVSTQLLVVDDNRAEDEIRSALMTNLGRHGDYVIVNYRRDRAGQQGGGHISPLGAYDTESDSFLVLDVNPANARWVWMPAKALIKGMRSFDTVENRGYIQVSPR
ncbi:MAG: phytochelatin synthase family protein [Rhodocyclaceae bacterium]